MTPNSAISLPENRPRPSADQALTLRRLDAIVQEILAGLADFGYDHLLITAGSAVTILDACLHGEPLRMRDFDLVLLADREVTRRWADKLGRSLDSPHLKYIPRYLWTRSRFHPERPHEPWNAGWGLIFDADGLEVDLSIYHDAAAHETNGLLDIHRVRLPVSSRRPLGQLTAALAQQSFESAIEKGLIEDPWSGYSAWRARQARVVCWPPIRLEPIQGAIRVVRESVQKLKQTRLDADLAAELSRAIRAGTSLDTAHLDIRNLLKVLGDEAAATELLILEELGIFDHWLSGLGRRIVELGRQDLSRLLRHREPSTPWAVTRLSHLLKSMAPTDQQEVIGAVGLMEQGLAAQLRHRLNPAA